MSFLPIILRYWLIIGLSSKVRLSIEDVVERFIGYGVSVHIVLVMHVAYYSTSVKYSCTSCLGTSTPYLDVAK